MDGETFILLIFFFIGPGLLGGILGADWAFSDAEIAKEFNKKALKERKHRDLMDKALRAYLNSKKEN